MAEETVASDTPARTPAPLIPSTRMKERRCHSACCHSVGFPQGLRQGNGSRLQSGDSAMCPRGTQQMAQKLRDHWQHNEDETVYIRTDIRNAFNEVHRQAAIDDLARAHPLLASLHGGLITPPPTTAVLKSTPAHEILCTNAGIPQGDPLSSLSFAHVLAEPLAHLAALP